MSKYIKQEITNNFTQIKIIIIGKSGTGKSSYVNRWIKNTFNESVKSTIVSENGSKLYKYKNKTYKINLWDIVGQDHFASLIKTFSKDAKGCITMSDILIPSSLNDALNWKKSLDENQSLLDGNPIPNILIQNKLDLINKEENNDFSLVEEFSKKNNFDAYFRTSAKTGENVNESMDKLIDIVINKLNEIDINELNKQKNSFALEPKKSNKIDKIRNDQNICC